MDIHQLLAFKFGHHMPDTRSKVFHVREIMLQGCHLLWPKMDSDLSQKHVRFCTQHGESKYQTWEPSGPPYLRYCVYTDLKTFQSLTSSGLIWLLTSIKNNSNIIVLNTKNPYPKYETCTVYPFWDIVFTNETSHTYTYQQTHMQHMPSWLLRFLLLTTRNQ